MPLVALLIAACLWTSAFVDWRLSWHSVDIPVSDLLAMGIAGVYGLCLLWKEQFSVGTLRSDEKAAPLALPASWAWLGFLLASLLGCFLVNADGEMYYFVARKPLFSWLSYGVGVVGVVRLLPDSWLRQIACLHIFWLSGLILPPAVYLLFTDNSGAILELPGLINNHKVFAVALAPWIGALLRWRPIIEGRIGAYSRIILGVALLAIFASMSKAAWVTTLVGMLAFLEWRGRPLLARPFLAAGISLVGILSMMAVPFLTGQANMADSFDSRWSLNVRAWRMFSGSPWYGWGAGTSTRWLMNDPRHYRIDGVDAHGVFQKVAAENGLIGLLPYLAAYLWFLHYFWRAAMTGDRFVQGAAILGLGLHLNLLLSTDYFSGAHWGPLAIAIAIVAKRKD